MRQVQIRFEADPGAERIEILIRAPEEDEQVAAIMKRLGGPLQESLTVFDRNDMQRMIPVGDIVSASVDGKRIQIVTNEGTYYTKQSMRSLESLLDGRLFVRISRYEIVNLAKVRRFDFTVAGTLRLELAGGTETWASRRCIPAIRRRLTEGR